MRLGILNYLFRGKKRVKDLQVRYSYWRVRIFYAMYIGYVVYYFTRSSFKILDTFLINDGLLTKRGHGLILAVSGLAYAVSKFLGGILTDLTNPRLLMFIGLLLSGIINILIAQQTSFNAFMVLWTINGLAQGLGWPPVAKMLTRWYTKKERGSWWGFWSTSHNLGEFLMPFLAISSSAHWRMGLYLPGIIAIFTSFFLLDRLRSSPEKVNLPPINKYMGDDSDSELYNKKESSFKSILFKYVFTNLQVWSLVFASVFIYFIRGAVSPWVSHIFLEKGYSYVQSISIISAFELGGLFGSFTSGWISDRFFNGKRSLVNIIFSVGIIISSLLIWYNLQSYALEYLLFTLLGFCVYGPQMLLGVAVAEVSNKEATSTSTGFVGLWSYIGISLAHVIVPGFKSDTYFLSLLVCAAAALIFFLPLLSTDYFRKRSK